MISKSPNKKIHPYDECVLHILRVLTKNPSEISKNEYYSIIEGLSFLDREFGKYDASLYEYSTTTHDLLFDKINYKFKQTVSKIKALDWKGALLSIRGLCGSSDSYKSKTVIIINGIGGSGKDSIVDIFKRLYCDKVNSSEESYRRIMNISSVDCVKEAAKVLGANIISKDDNYRIFLRKLKQLAIDHYDGPKNIIMKQIEEADKDAIIFVHIRELEEANKIEKEVLNKINSCKFLKLLVVGDDSRITKADTGVDSLESVMSWDYDYTIENKSTLDNLIIEVKKFMEEVL